MKCVGISRNAERSTNFGLATRIVGERTAVPRHHGLVNDRADAKGDVDAILDQVHASLG